MLILMAPRVEGLADALERARRKSGLKRDALAALLGMTGPQYSQWLASTTHVSLNRLFLALHDPDGRVFLHAVLTECCDLAGVAQADAVAEQLRQFGDRFAALMDRVQVRMAKSELREAERAKEETA